MSKFVYIFLVILLCSTAPLQGFAATAESVTNQINDVTKQIQALDTEIANYKSKISATAGEAKTLANLIKELTLTRDKLLAEAKQTQKKIVVTTVIIGSLNDSIATQQAAIDNGKVVLEKIFREVQEYDHISFIERMLTRSNIRDVSGEYNNLLTLNEKIHTHIQTVKDQQTALIDSKQKKVAEQSKLTELKKTLDEKKLAVDATQKEKNSLLTETKSREIAYQKMLAEREKQRDAFEKDLRDYEAQLKFILNPKLLPGEGSGILAWPLDTIFITQLFGKTVSAKRLYVSGSHSGVDLRASIGTQVKSMGTGVIEGTGDTDMYCKGSSFGKWVFIKYNNGLSSTFGHLSVISGQVGQKVVAGDSVGLSGNTGHSTGPHLHVTVYASQGASVKTVPSISCNGKIFTMPIAPTSAYLDPLLYLPKVPTSLVKNDTSKD